MKTNTGHKTIIIMNCITQARKRTTQLDFSTVSGEMNKKKKNPDTTRSDN